jgi:hypothetical protein
MIKRNGEQMYVCTYMYTYEYILYVYVVYLCLSLSNSGFLNLALRKQLEIVDVKTAS